MNSWKWTKGESCQKSYKNDQIHNFDNFSEIENSFLKRNVDLVNDFNNNHQNNINLSFNKNNEWKKKDAHNDKLSSRHMIIQKNINPYLNTNNYIDDLINQDEFLRPIDSNFNDVKKQMKIKE